MSRLLRIIVNKLFRRAAYIPGMSTFHRLNDNLPEFADLRTAHPGIPDFAWRIIAGYTPKDHSKDAWAAVRPFTVTTAAGALANALNEDAKVTYDVTRLLMTVTARFHMWVWARTGRTLTVNSIYTQNNIDRYLDAAYKNHARVTRWSASRQLVKVGRELADADLIALPAPNGKRRAPFTAKQIASMHSWANSLTTVTKRQHAWALLGLAGGAGLTAAEIVATRISHIDRDGDVLFVNVPGANARRVPVRHAWARVLLRSIEGREHTEEALFRGPWIEEYPPRIIQTFLTDHPAKVRPTPSALRAAWILHHINNDVPPQVLMAVAGIDTFQTLGRFYEHARSRPITDYTRLLVGAETAR